MIKKENDSIVYEKVIPAHGAEYVSFPESMRPEIGDYLRSQGISRLYSHALRAMRLRAPWPSA